MFNNDFFKLNIRKFYVVHKCKKTTIQRTICYLTTEKKNDKTNSQRTKLHICKPRHTSRCFSLQKSSFLADAPAENDTFVLLN